MYRNLLDYLVRDIGAPILFVEYNLVPDSYLPGPINNGFDEYSHLLSLNVSASRVMIMGDSAGGGMALLVAQRVRDGDIRPPACITLISPWTDLSLSGESFRSLAKSELILNPLSFNIQLSAWLTNWRVPLADPSISPLFGKFDGLPPVYFLVGSDEVLLSDSTRAHGKALEAGVFSKLEIQPYLFHQYPLYGEMPEAFNARQSIKNWWNLHLH